jgi:hypothetical protein
MDIMGQITCPTEGAMHRLWWVRNIALDAKWEMSNYWRDVTKLNLM